MFITEQQQRQLLFTVCTDRGVMAHADRDNDGNGWAQATAETLRGSISPI